jgi:hypothetical protein
MLVICSFSQNSHRGLGLVATNFVDVFLFHLCLRLDAVSDPVSGRSPGVKCPREGLRTERLVAEHCQFRQHLCGGYRND